MKAGVALALGLVLGQSGFSLDTDSADLLDSESTDLILLTTLEYDLVMGLGSLTVLGFGSGTVYRQKLFYENPKIWTFKFQGHISDPDLCL